MCAIVVDHPLLDSLKSIGETSFDHVEVNRPGNDCTNIAGSGSATWTAGAAGNAFDEIWKIIECSPGRVDIARRGEASEDKEHRCLRVVRDRKSTRLNSSHGYISYVVFCLKKKKMTVLLNEVLIINDCQQALELIHQLFVLL